ncbi:uncharacterized protein LOC108917166 [Anoplophora glabripennis]|uniref:uncharacterized protein LOC108917166 n=1 Tax=Anoplophora glabripennis TaxID=217634 RepID=UPI0008749E04|nr:uncharacterized protein LOC108917166 [Anoplophora glabripennis]
MDVGVLLLAIFCSNIPQIFGHGRLIEPPSRASAWRYGFDTPHNYNDHELFCGGFTRQWVKNEGKCGVCGDPWDSKLPRAHEYGGTYGQGIVVRKYSTGSIINIRVELTANHYGYFEFSLCPNYKAPTQECLSKNILKLVRPQEDVDHKNVRYFPKEGNKVYEMKYRLPKNSCEHCLLQWRYIAGNNWGNCPNGTGAVGCGPQEEFRACADITISGKASDEPMVSVEEEETPELVPEYVPTTTIVPSVPTPEESYNPISALIITLVSFLVVFSILSLLYFHFYQVGKQVKNWIKGPSKKTTQNLPPMPPPRARRTRSPSARRDRSVMHEIDLTRESLA